MVREIMFARQAILDRPGHGMIDDFRFKPKPVFDALFIFVTMPVNG
jgi:hypothetical protein